jgi:hypothetical protein
MFLIVAGAVEVADAGDAHADVDADDTVDAADAD